jgi:hypothetical protein
MRNRPLQCDCRPLSSHEGGRGAIPERKRVLCKGETQRKRLAIPRFLGHVDASTPSAMSSIYARWFSIAWYFRVLSVEAVSGFMRRERYQRALSRSGWHGIFCIQGRLSKGDGRRGTSRTRPQPYRQRGRPWLNLRKPARKKRPDGPHSAPHGIRNSWPVGPRGDDTPGEPG